MNKKVSDQCIKQFQRRIFSFYKKHKRDLPWRSTTDPYKILLSELMLQQTQVTRVIPFYEKWIFRWPTVSSLASASRSDVLNMWMGLGYNSRAINLHKAAQKIITQFEGNVLEAMKHYTEIPGVGRYTSCAVQIFAANADLVTVDTNIRRIFIKEFRLSEKITDKELWGLAEQCLPAGKSRDWHNALMDYGAQILTSKKIGIKPKTRQSCFEGSDRQIRARVLRHLLQKDSSLSELEASLKIDKVRLTKILDTLNTENIIILKKDKYQVNEG